MGQKEVHSENNKGGGCGPSFIPALVWVGKSIH